MNEELRERFAATRERGVAMGVDGAGYVVGIAAGVKERVGTGRLTALAMLLFLIGFAALGVMGKAREVSAGLKDDIAPFGESAAELRFVTPFPTAEVPARQSGGQPVVQVYDESGADYPFAELCVKYGKLYDLPHRLLGGLIWKESAWNTNAVSRDGAGSLGLGQFIPGTWIWITGQMGVNWSLADRADPEKSIHAMAWFLDWIRSYVGKPGMSEREIVIKMLYGYNAGPGNAVGLANGYVPPYRADYVNSILKRAGY